MLKSRPFRTGLYRRSLPGLRLALIIAGFSGLTLFATAQISEAEKPEITSKMFAFLDTLNEKQRSAASFKFDSGERTNWHYVPTNRKGLPFKEMSDEQRKAAHSLLKTGLSESGYKKAKNVILLESILAVLEEAPDRRDSTKYYLSIFGTPSNNSPWAWRFEGHHLSMNFTVIDGKLGSQTPSFLGANPGIVEGGEHDGLRVLGEEEDAGRALIVSLNAGQQKTATLAGKTPRDILSKQLPKANRLPDEGIALADLDATQVDLFWKLVGLYVGRANDRGAAEVTTRLKTVPASDLRFAWVGSIKPKEGHYYRITGPDLLIEYANTQNGAAHPHAVWRGIENDFGRDLLRDHLKKSH